MADLCERCIARALLADASSAAEGSPGQSGYDPLLAPVRGVPERLGDYQLLQQVGHGGMGVVYRARQLSLDRVVAVKMLLMGRFASEESVQRFLREASAAACLQHPNIVGVHEIGQAEGHHYFSMEYVEGRSLAERLRLGPLAPVPTAELCRVLADAIHYAHGQGIMHRDLKPSNVLLDAAGRPHITDFGLAKRLDTTGTDLTLEGELMGSPRYLSPEQAEGRQLEVGPRSDVYALGVILYECLTGHPPFGGTSLQETLLQIRDSDVIPPHQYCPGLSMDLEAIVLKCLEKRPVSRYRTAADLGADLDRFLQGEPTRARPVGRWGRWGRWARRKPVHASAVGLILLTALVSSLEALHARSSRRQVQSANERLASSLRRMEWQAAEDSIQDGRRADGMVALARLLREKPGDKPLQARLAWMLGNVAFATPAAPPSAHLGPLTAVQFDPAGNSYLTASLDGTVGIWRTRDGREIRSLPGRAPLARAVWGDAGRRILSVLRDGGVRLWDSSSGELIREWTTQVSEPGPVVQGTSGAIGAIVVDPRSVSVVRLDTGETIGAPLGMDSAVSALAIDDEGRTVMLGSDAGIVRVWRLQGTERFILADWRFPGPVSNLAISPDGTRVIVGMRRGGFLLCDTSDLGHPLGSAEGESGLQFVRFSPAGRRALICRFGEWPEMWDLGAGSREQVLQRTDTEIALDAAWSPDGRLVALAFRSGRAEIRDIATGALVVEPIEHVGPIVSLEFHPDGSRVVTASHDTTARVWDVRARATVSVPAKLPGRIGGELVQAGGQLLVGAWRGKAAWFCDARRGAPVSPALHHEAEVLVASLSPDGSRLAVGADGVWLWGRDEGRRPLGPLGAPEAIERIAWCPDGRWLLTAGAAGFVRQWDAQTGARMNGGAELGSAVQRLEVSPDGARYAAVAADATVHLIEAATGRVVVAPLRHQGRIWTAEFSPDSRRLVTASLDRTVRVWDVATGAQVGRTMQHERGALVARFSPDGRVIASGGEDRMVRLWDAATGHALVPGLRHGSRVWILAFSSDGSRLLTAADLGAVQVWDTASGAPMTGILDHPGTMLRAWFAPDGCGIVTATHKNILKTWELDSVPVRGASLLPSLAEALAGRRLDDQGLVAPLPVESYRQAVGELARLRQSGESRGWAERFSLRHPGASGIAPDREPAAVARGK